MYGGNGGDGDMGDRRRKRSFDDGYGRDYRDGREGRDGGYKRSRYDDRGSYRPRYNDRAGGRYGREGGYERHQGESERARAWRLAKKAVVELGDSDSEGADPVAQREQLQRASQRLLGELEADQQEVKLSHLSALVLRATARLAHKTALYATLVGLVNAQQPAFGRELVAAAVRAVQRDLDFFNSDKHAELVAEARASGVAMGDEDTFRQRGDVEAVALRVRLTVRLLGELVATHVAKSEDVLALLDTLQGVCTPEDFQADSEEAQSLRKREDAAAWKDFFASVVLDTLLHCGQVLARGCEDMYASLLSRCKEYVSHREEESSPRGGAPSSWLTRRLKLDLLWEADGDEDLAARCAQCDPLALSWQAINAIRAEAGTTPAANGATGDGNESADAADAEKTSKGSIPGVNCPQTLFSSTFDKAEAHPLTTSLSIDLANFDSGKIPAYTALFRILTEDSGAAGAAIAALHPASYLVARGHFAHALETCHPKPAIAAKVLLGMCRAYNARFAAVAAAGAPPTKSEYLLVETLLVAALNEGADAKLGYYCSVLYHLVKNDAHTISPALAIVVELLFREVPTMRASATDAFVLLFSHFLSNFEFKWRWAHWAHVLEASEDDPQRLFVSAVIERCVRLSYLQHMQSALPSEFHMLLPPAPKPRIRFQSAQADSSTTDAAMPATAEEETSAASTFYQSVTTKLKGHPPASALRSWLDEELPRLEISRAEAVEVVWTCILEAGAATFTHMRLLLEKYGKPKELFGGEDQPAEQAEADELVLVKTVASVWLKSPQHIGLILNAMLRQGLLRPSTIVTWVFTPDAVQQYSWPYVWGILNATLGFVQDNIRSKQKQLESSNAGSSSEARENEEMPDVAALEDALKRTQDELRAMLVQLFRGFNRVISEHKMTCDGEGADYHDNWFRSALAQMQAMGRRFRVPLEGVLDELQLSVFGSGASADHDAAQVFHFVRDAYRSA